MSKNILNRVKQSLESSSKKVHDEKIPLETDQQIEGLGSSSAVDNYRQRRDRSEYYRSVASNYQVSKMLTKIPILISQNQELKHKVDNLQQELLRFRKQNGKSMLDSRENNPDRLRDDNSSYIRIQTDHSSSREMVNNSRVRWGSMSRDKYNDYNNQQKDRMEQENYMCRSADKKKRNLAKLSSQVIQFFQQQIEQLKHDNERLQTKYQSAIKTEKYNSEDIDKIKKDFQNTIKKQEQMFKKQQTFHQDKVRQLQSKVLQLSSQNEALKIQNSVLVEKLAFFEVSLATQTKGAAQNLNMVEKQIWGYFDHSRKHSYSSIWDQREPQRKDSRNGSRVKFIYPNS